MTVKLNTGKIAIPIEIDGEKSNIYFNPSDPDLMLRFDQVGDRINEAIKDIEDFEIDESGNPIEPDKIEIARKVRESICEAIDWAFNGEVSKIVFAKINPLAITGDTYFIWQFTEAIAPVIGEYYQKANAKAQQRMEKHIAKYIS